MLAGSGSGHGVDAFSPVWLMSQTFAEFPAATSCGVAAVVSIGAGGIATSSWEDVPRAIGEDALMTSWTEQGWPVGGWGSIARHRP